MRFCFTEFCISVIVCKCLHFFFVSIATKQLIALGLSEPFHKFDAQMFETDFPGCEWYKTFSDEHLACLARTYTATIYHPSGTCRMGHLSDPGTVVDPQLRLVLSYYWGVVSDRTIRGR